MLEYPELGMEAVWRIEVEDFPAFIVVDDKGNDFFESVSKPVALGRRADAAPTRRAGPPVRRGNTNRRCSPQARVRGPNRSSSGSPA